MVIPIPDKKITSAVWGPCEEYIITGHEDGEICHYDFKVCFLKIVHCIGGVMVSVLVLSAVDREFEPRLGLTKDYKIAICCFSAKHAALRRKSKD